MSPRRVVACLTLLVLVAAALSTVVYSLPGLQISSVLTPHDPITIIGDANLTAPNGVTGGSGTSLDPYIISGWNITDAWPGNGITIRNTTAYVVIRDVFINASYRDVEPEFPRGVALLNVSHVTVMRVTVLDNAYAFTVGLGSSNVSFRNNVAVGNWLGLGIFGAQDVWAEGNLLMGGAVPNPAGMSVGISMGWCGVPVCPGVRVTVVGNNITNNAQGIRVQTSSAVSVYHNNFFNDTTPAAADSSNYSWDDGYPSGGNHWSSYAGGDQCSGPLQDVCTALDGIGDTPFTFPNSGEDRYPLMKAWLGPSPPAANTPPYYVNFTWSPGTGNTSTLFAFTAKVADAEDPPSEIQVRWDWNGDGTWDTARSTNKTNQHVFTAPGNYSVVLEGMDTGGLTANKSYVIVVTPVPPPPPPPLHATITAIPTSGTMPLTVTFTSSVTGGEPPYQYDWHFGDGATSPSANTVHIYLTGGDFPVWLNVWDHAGSDTQSPVLFVNVTAAAVNLTVTTPTEFVSSSSGITVSFTSSVNGGTPPYTYLWDFGDSSRSTDANPVHTYAGGGTYTVIVRVTDAQGQSATRTLSVPVLIHSSLPASPLPLALIAAAVASGALASLFASLWLRERRRRPPPPGPPI